MNEEHGDEPMKCNRKNGVVVDKPVVATTQQVPPSHSSGHLPPPPSPLPSTSGTTKSTNEQLTAQLDLHEPVSMMTFEMPKFELPKNETPINVKVINIHLFLYLYLCDLIIDNWTVFIA